MYLLFAHQGGVLRGWCPHWAWLHVMNVLSTPTPLTPRTVPRAPQVPLPEDRAKAAEATA